MEIGKVEAIVFDVDGTLVDSNYEHTIAWARAFKEAGAEVPTWRIHRHIGMGGDSWFRRSQAMTWRNGWATGSASSRRRDTSS